MRQTDPTEQQEKLILALFVTPNNRERAIVNLAKVLGDEATAIADVIELDVSAVPEVAEIAQIVATPTLVRYWPQPRLTIVGDLSNLDHVRTAILDCSESSVTELRPERRVEREKLLNNLRSQSAGEIRRQQI